MFGKGSFSIIKSQCASLNMGVLQLKLSNLFRSIKIFNSNYSSEGNTCFLYILGHLGPVLASVCLPESTDITQSRSVTVLKKKNN